MRTFTIRLVCPDRTETIPEVASFTGQDQSGRFGILGGAERRLTALVYGLAVIRHPDGQAEYLALPGGILKFQGNELRIATTGFLRSVRAEEMLEALDKRVFEQGQKIEEVKKSIHRLDEELMRRLKRLGKSAIP